jgi:hypothetical protein
LAAGGSAEWRYSTDSKTWQPIGSLTGPCSQTFVAALDSRLSPRGQPTYCFWLQLVLSGDAATSGISFESDIQMAVLALPELEVGTNRIEYTDASPGDRQVRITHRWIERSAWRPPHAPKEALAPSDGREVQGSRVTFRWSPAAGPGGEPVADYHIELSQHPDMRWPLSPNFERLISLTPWQGKCEWTLPYVGLLNSGTNYFWRVRACDRNGVWGPWSRAFSFRVQAPGVPRDVKLVTNGDHDLQLQWQPNPQGSAPVAYKVYGSDERGFTVSDSEYLVNRGKGFVRNIEEYKAKADSAPDAGLVKTPANLIAQVSGTSLPVVGPELTMPNVNKAYYRVVAVDRAGSESGPSDYAEVPRPLVWNRPVQVAQVGKPYRFQPRAIRSDGDLRCRPTAESSYNAAFWDREEYRFAPVRLPDGFTLDAKTGLVSGMPGKPGAVEVAIKIENQLGPSRVLSYQLVIQGP